MSKIIKVPRCPYDAGDRLFAKTTVEFNSGMTVLVGCNGSGKSTLMTLIEEKLKPEKDVLVLTYDDRNEGGSTLMSYFAWRGDMNQMANMFMRSEGERIIYGVGNFASSIRSKIKNKNPKEIWILLDTVGSGLSIDGIRDIKDLKNCVLEDNPNIDVYFIVSTNEFEFAKGEDCIDVGTLKHITFSSYDEYASYVMRTRKRKDKRYNAK